jgi:hypothetical protein
MERSNQAEQAAEGNHDSGIEKRGTKDVGHCSLSRTASAHLPRRVVAKPEQLLVVMPSMHQMKLPPLCRSQRTQNRMVEQLYVAPEAGFTLREDCIHRSELCAKLVSHFLRRHSPRLGDCGGLAAGGHVAQSYDDERQRAMRHGCSRRERFAACQDSLEAFDRSGIRQVQMLYHL